MAKFLRAYVCSRSRHLEYLLRNCLPSCANMSFGLPEMSSGNPKSSAVVHRECHLLIMLNDEAHFWLNGYVNKQNCRIWSEANPQVYVETPLHPEKLTVWCALWAGGILLQKR
ncbi:hypothetical protein TNCV_998901 [Trichonephila clavipes]|nr:hypothetical protein TNCV_998901 [Trichonephila clavipes]